jgi:hypothetical protein
MPSKDRVRVQIPAGIRDNIIGGGMPGRREDHGFNRLPD